MALDAFVDRVPVAAVRFEHEVTLVAFFDLHHFTARGLVGPIDREVDRLVLAGVANGEFLGGAFENLDVLVAFHADRPRSGCFGRDCVGEGPGIRAASRSLCLAGILGNVACVVRARSGKHQIEAVHGRGRYGISVLVANVECQGRFVALGAALDTHGLEFDSHQTCREPAIKVGALDGRVEFDFTLRRMAVGALVVGDLRHVEVVFAGGEVHVVMAGAASGPAGLLVPGVVLGCAGLRVMANRAVAGIRRQVDLREIGVADLIRFAGLHAGQVGAHVDLVDQHREVEVDARAGLEVVRLVAHHAVFHLAAAAVRIQRIVTGAVAGLGLHDVPDLRDLCATGNPAIDVVVNGIRHAELSQIPRHLASDRGRDVLLIVGR